MALCLKNYTSWGGKISQLNTQVCLCHANSAETYTCSTSLRCYPVHSKCFCSLHGVIIAQLLRIAKAHSSPLWYSPGKYYYCNNRQELETLHDNWSVMWLLIDLYTVDYNTFLQFSCQEAGSHCNFNSMETQHVLRVLRDNKGSTTFRVSYLIH